MIDSDLERRLERMFAGDAERPIDTTAAWHRLRRARAHARRNRRLMAIGLAAAVAIAAVAGPAVVHGLASSTPGTGAHHNTSGKHGARRPAPGGHLTIAARIPQPGAGSAPGDLAIAGVVVGQRDAVWGITYRDYLFKIDPRTNKVTFREHIPGLIDIAAGGGSIWAVTALGKADGDVLKIDAASGHVAATFPLPHACDQVFYEGEDRAFYEGAQLWLACGHLAVDFIRLDPATGQVIAATGRLYGVTSAAATPSGIWYVGNSGVAGFLGTGKRLRWVRVNDSTWPVTLASTNSLVYGQGSLWALTSDESVARIDPATGRIVRIYTYQTYDPSDSLGLNFLAVGLKSLWFLEGIGYEATGVLRVSMATGLPQGKVAGVGSCGEPCWQIYVADGSVWVPTQTHITRIDPVSRPRRTARR